jgi:hypothetical protein
MDLWKFVQPEEPFHTLVVWPGTIVAKGDDIETFFMTEYDTRIKRVGCVPVLTNREYDFAFFVHDDDVMKFAIQRMKYIQDPDMFCRWWEDIYFNHQEDEFPDEFCICYPPCVD